MLNRMHHTPSLQEKLALASASNSIIFSVSFLMWTSELIASDFKLSGKFEKSIWMLDETKNCY